MSVDDLYVGDLSEGEGNVIAVNRNRNRSALRRTIPHVETDLIHICDDPDLSGVLDLLDLRDLRIHRILLYVMYFCHGSRTDVRDG